MLRFLPLSIALLFLVPVTFAITGPQPGPEPAPDPWTAAGDPVAFKKFKGQAYILTKEEGSSLRVPGAGAAQSPESPAVACIDSDGDGRPDTFTEGVCVRFADLPREMDGLHLALDDTRVEADARSANVSRSLMIDSGSGALRQFIVCVDLDGDGVCRDVSGARDPPPCSDVMMRNKKEEVERGQAKRVVNPVPVPRTLIEGDLWRMCARNGGFPGYIIIPLQDEEGPRYDAGAGSGADGRVTPVRGAGSTEGLHLRTPNGDKIINIIKEKVP